jgi:type IV pilus assembly protein PilM
MARAFPPDVVVLDTDSLVHARLAPGKANPQIVQAKNYRLAADTFTPSVVTPELANEAALAEGLRRLKMETGKWNRVSVLLPDSWFRINILDLPTIPDRASEAMEVVRWSLKRTLPIPPDSLRVAYSVLSKTPAGVKILVLSAVEKSLNAIEKVFAAAGLEVILIEPIGLNIWNAVAIREAVTANDRLFLYVREREFTTAVFRGEQPLFIRSRNLAGERTLEQEIRLSATYLRDNLGTDVIEQCYVAGSVIGGADVAGVLAEEFSAPVRTLRLGEFAELTPGVDQAPNGSVYGIDAELTACTGVFTG